MSSHFFDSPAVQEDDAVAVDNRGESVRHNQSGSALSRSLQRLLNDAL